MYIVYNNVSPGKSEADCDRERSLIDQWVCLTEERNAVLVPAAGSGIPGAPADWEPPSGMEQHVPVIFLDLNGEFVCLHPRKIVACRSVISRGSFIISSTDAY